MRKRSVERALLPVLIVAMAVPAGSIVIRHDREDAGYLELGARFPVTCAMNLPGGEGTLVAPAWILTAAHVAKWFKPAHTVRCADAEYEVAEVAVYPDGREGKDDLALVKLVREVQGTRPVALYRGRDEAGRIVTFVGRGGFGTGLTGPEKRDGLFRGATNEVWKTTQGMLVFRFDEPPGGTPLEGISGPGDSGGPALLEVDGTLFVAGVSSGQDNREQGREGVYGVVEYYTRVSAYARWIDDTISGKPQPKAVDPKP